MSGNYSVEFDSLPNNLHRKSTSDTVTLLSSGSSAHSRAGSHSRHPSDVLNKSPEAVFKGTGMSRAKTIGRLTQEAREAATEAFASFESNHIVANIGNLTLLMVDVGLKVSQDAVAKAKELFDSDGRNLVEINDFLRYYARTKFPAIIGEDQDPLEALSQAELDKVKDMFMKYEDRVIPAEILPDLCQNANIGEDLMEQARKMCVKDGSNVKLHDWLAFYASVYMPESEVPKLHVEAVLTTPARDTLTSEGSVRSVRSDDSNASNRSDLSDKARGKRGHPTPAQLLAIREATEEALLAMSEEERHAYKKIMGIDDYAIGEKVLVLVNDEWVRAEVKKVATNAVVVHKILMPDAPQSEIYTKNGGNIRKLRMRQDTEDIDAASTGVNGPSEGFGELPAVGELEERYSSSRRVSTVSQIGGSSRRVSTTSMIDRGEQEGYRLFGNILFEDEDEIREHEREMAATIIQSKYREHLEVKRANEAKQQEDMAATKIQAQFRGMQSRKLSAREKRKANEEMWKEQVTPAIAPPKKDPEFKKYATTADIRDKATLKRMIKYVQEIEAENEAMYKEVIQQRKMRLHMEQEARSRIYQLQVQVKKQQETIEKKNAKISSLKKKMNEKSKEANNTTSEPSTQQNTTQDSQQGSRVSPGPPDYDDIPAYEQYLAYRNELERQYFVRTPRKAPQTQGTKIALNYIRHQFAKPSKKKVMPVSPRRPRGSHYTYREHGAHFGFNEINSSMTAGPSSVTEYQSPPPRKLMNGSADFSQAFPHPHPMSPPKGSTAAKSSSSVGKSYSTKSINQSVIPPFDHYESDVSRHEYKNLSGVIENSKSFTRTERPSSAGRRRPKSARSRGV